MAAQRKKKVIKSTSQRKKAPVRRKDSVKKRNEFTHYTDFLFSRKQYIYAGAGVLLVILGLLLMTGGHMPDDEVWDTGLIYSFRRITLAPILILAGLVLPVVAIFKK